MTDAYLEDLEFANKANIEAARKFKAERDALKMALRDILNTTPEERQNPAIWFKRVEAARALFPGEA